MHEKTLVIARNEEACKLFDCLINYKKLISTVEIPDLTETEDHITVEALQIPLMQLAETQEIT